MMIVSLVVVAALVVWLVLFTRDRPTGTTTRRRGADELLAERFARGEIDENEFLRRRQFLDGQRTL